MKALISFSFLITILEHSLLIWIYIKSHLSCCFWAAREPCPAHDSATIGSKNFISFFLTHSLVYSVYSVYFCIIFQLSNEIDSIILFESVYCGIGALGLVFVTCEFMQRITNSHSAIDDAINDLDWYWVPTNMNLTSIFLISIMYTQKPLEVQFFGSISCSRDQFRRVRKKVPTKNLKLFKWIVNKSNRILQVVYSGYNGFMVFHEIINWTSLHD